MYCQIDEFLTETCEKAFYFCKWKNWEHKSNMINFHDWCLLYKDMVTFSADFNEIRLCNKIFKLVDVFSLFFRIMNYWCSVSKQVVDEFFSLLPTFNHIVTRKNLAFLGKIVST